jgi:arylformamidase
MIPAMTIDYEAEYNNRARVKEHPEILARLSDDAGAYRAQVTTEGRAELGIGYGPSPRQFVDIFFSHTGRDAPLAMFIHGGYWRSLEPRAFSSLARGLNAHGVTVALAGYDLCPDVSIADIIAQMERACLFLWNRFGKRILVHGHSAGGHLAAAMLATDWQRHGGPADLVPAAMAISGLFDLAPMIATSMNVDFKLDEAEARRLSPLFWPAPARRTLDAVVGGAESSEFLRQSRIIVDQWGRAGVATRYEAIADANHFTVIEPLADPQSAMVMRLLALAPDGHQSL